MRVVIAMLALALAGLQYQLWIAPDGLRQRQALRDAVAEQKRENARLQARNDALEAEVRDLKQGLEAVEERARSELGMIREGETFYQVVDGAPAEPLDDSSDETPDHGRD